MPSPFVVFALPRSRTAWLANYLNAGGRFPVGHDITIECNCTEDFFASYANGMRGTVETGSMMAWRLMKQRIPDLKILLIRRPLDEVKRSLLQFGIEPASGELEAREEILNFLETLPHVDSIEFRDLYITQCRRWVWETLLEEPWDAVWDSALVPINIQIDMQARLRQLHRRFEPLTALKAEIAMLQKELPVCNMLN
jgi:hypothetical protein